MRVSSRFMWVFLFLMFKTQVITAMEPSDVVEGSVLPALVPASSSTVGIITGIVDRRKNLNNRQFMAEEAEQWPDGFQATLWPHIETQIFGRIHAFLSERQDIFTVSGSVVVPDTEDFVKGAVVGFKESTAAMFLTALQNRLADGSIAAIPSYFWQSTEVFLQNEVAGIIRCVHEAQKPFHGPAETRNFLLFRGQRENFCTNLIAEFEELVTNELAKKVLGDNGHSVAAVFQDTGDSDDDSQGGGISMVAVGISIVPVEGEDDEGEDGEPLQSNQDNASGSAISSSDQSDAEEDEEGEDEEDEEEIDAAVVQGNILVHWFQTQDPEALEKLKDFIFDVPEEGQQ